ncbi:hypothetical protein RF11_14444 [Thelohanellus kitauei]|uniref:Uncharacterized protein n=1 Tax=Thelohanellus kitauei TaxID=669202 RepID=A0A0C2JNV5_THEKT|nr:hypothetical protein RF11_14444 [Thelohanellus kitauei]
MSLEAAEAFLRANEGYKFNHIVELRVQIFDESFNELDKEHRDYLQAFIFYLRFIYSRVNLSINSSSIQAWKLFEIMWVVSAILVINIGETLALELSHHAR